MELIGKHPGRSAVIYFLAVIGAGTILLLMPVCSSGNQVSFMDALFTSTSAVCVTGLTVLGTSTDFSIWGQTVIMVLIQLGGLGIMVFATSLVLWAGSGLSLSVRLGLSDSFGAKYGTSSGSVIRSVAAITFIVEAIGALLLYFRFRPSMDSSEAAFAAVFHSISAFCNAGFSTFGDSLESFQNDSPTLFIFMVLIVLGGLGFVVIGESLRKAVNREIRMSLHSKLCLATTVILIVGGALAFMVAERSNLLAGESITVGITNSLFQSVTCRTAGFNSLAQSRLTELGVLVTMFLMFIGGCPGSTAGGIKASTLAVLGVLAFRRLRGFEHATAFRTRIGHDSIGRALAVVAVAMFVLIVGFSLFVLIVEPPMSHEFTRGLFMENLFEVISAFGTVGLTMGVTSHLGAGGKLILIVLMFIGRVGLLTLAMALARSKIRGEVVYLEESVAVG